MGERIVRAQWNVWGCFPPNRSRRKKREKGNREEGVQENKGEKSEIDAGGGLNNSPNIF